MLRLSKKEVQMKKYNIGWGLTNACNMNCKFCYSKTARGELSECKLEDWIRFLDQNHEYIDSINYGTGENSLIPEFFAFVKYAREKYPHIKQSLTTNGFISRQIENSKEYFEIFKNCIDEIDVSIDFCVPQKHNLFRGNSKVFDWAVKTLEISKSLNKLCTIVFVGFDETLELDNLDGLFALAKKYGALLRMNIYRPVSTNPEINKKFTLSFEKLTSALNYINEKYEIVALSDSLLGSVFAGLREVCDNTGVDSIRILPDGSICPSTYLISEEYRNKYNIKEENVLKDLIFEVFNQTVVPKHCKGCQYETTCKGGVLDRRLLWYGTLEERDPYCPKRFDYEFPKTYFKTTKLSRVSVHDGYLPTLFFKNKDEE